MFGTESLLHSAVHGQVGDDTTEGQARHIIALPETGAMTGDSDCTLTTHSSGVSMRTIAAVSPFPGKRLTADARPKILKFPLFQHFLFTGTAFETPAHS